MKSLFLIVALALLALAPAVASAGGDADRSAPDFPPGVFSDGGHYTLGDFKGKLLVIFFFESECPNCKGMVPKWNEIVTQYKDKPVKFLAVGPHNSLASVKQYVTETKLAMPVFADNLDIMETMYGETISLNNVRQFRLVDGHGKIVAYDLTPAELDKALENIHWKYKDQGYEPQLSNIIELLEWNQYQPALNQLRPLRKNTNKKIAESAEKLYQAVKSEGEEWKTEAEKVADKKPVEAFDLYTKIAALFAGDDLAKEVAAPLKTLQTDKQVVAELAARKQYAQLYSAVPRAQFQQREQVSKFCLSIAKQYPDTPTADKADELSIAILKATMPKY